MTQAPPRQLGDLFPEASLPDDAAALEVRGLSADSRSVESGFVFFAVPGTKADGMRFVPQAVAAGAIAIVCGARPSDADGSVVWIETANVRLALAQASARFFGRQPQHAVAVTGTSGKTSVAAFVRQIWAKLGHQAGALGTTGVVSPSGKDYGALTTPDPVTLHRVLAQLAGEGVTHLAMEASSHGLDQRRLDGVKLEAGAFTNLSRDHLDYHPDLDSYLAAKLRLFSDLLAPGAGAVVNADCDVADEVIAACRARRLNIFTCGTKGKDLRLVSAETGPDHSIMNVVYADRSYTVRLPLAGTFMVSNALVAAGLCIVTGSDAAAVFSALESLEGAPGRLEKVGARNGAPVFVDYAHKPDALEKVLDSLRPLTRGKLVVVFGCGGDRDPGKRPIMGAIAAEKADVVIVTDDNPRSENPGTIRAEIVAAAPGALEIADRAEAIGKAVSMLAEGDVLVVAGKGHETGQLIGDTILPFSDHEAVLQALKEEPA